MDAEHLKKLALLLRNLSLKNEVRIMEVCGTHTTEFFKTGVRDMLPQNLVLIDGPGCPVCVTPNSYLDTAIEIGRKHGAVIATFGDMVKVPSSYSSLAGEKADGMDVRIVYSPLEALDIAEKNTGREIVFLSVGFETTAPAEAATVLEAKKRNIKNFSILPGNKLTVPAVKALLDSQEVKIDGFIIPGHVSALIGADAWRFIPEQYNKPCVVSGFEAHDLMTGLISLTGLILNGKNELKNEYSRVVKPEGNKNAIDIMLSVFKPETSVWRGLGPIPESGLAVREEYSMFDALKKFPVAPPEPREDPLCRCGELLRGLILPPDCPLFGKKCTPESPVGPCMVSTEGPCSAFFKYRSAP